MCGQRDTLSVSPLSSQCPSGPTLVLRLGGKCLYSLKYLYDTVLKFFNIQNYTYSFPVFILKTFKATVKLKL